MCKQVGKRCDVCTGCGRCPGVGADVSVIMKNKLAQETGPFSDREGRRLVTVDIGTTTIAMLFFNTDGTMKDSYAAVNPQTRYGADVLSRIQAAEDRETANELQTMVRTVLEQGFAQFGAHLAEGEKLFAVIAANTTMTYLLMGYDTRELGQAPFHASHLEREQVVINGVACVIFPGLSAFVGGDIVAGIHACKMAESEEITLLIDLGTNGEMALGNRKRILACATAAGPAFEGGVNKGVWGADMVSILARLKEERLLDGTGLMADEYFDTGVRIGDVCVTQAAVRAVQLAKGAIRAGIQILAEAYGIGFGEIGRVVLAGGFGYYLDPAAAAAIGLLPTELVDKTIIGGNTALAGALRLGRDLLAVEDSQAEGEQPAGEDSQAEGEQPAGEDSQAEGGQPADEDFQAEGGQPAGKNFQAGREQSVRAGFLPGRDCTAEILNLAQYPGFEELYIRFMDLE